LGSVNLPDPDFTHPAQAASRESGRASCQSPAGSTPLGAHPEDRRHTASTAPLSRCDRLEGCGHLTAGATSRKRGKLAVQIRGKQNREVPRFQSLALKRRGKQDFGFNGIMRGRRMVAMTRARSHTWAVGITPLIQPLLEAVLCVVMSLVHSVVATFGMRRCGGRRDWHTHSGPSALPQTKPDIHLKDPATPTESLSALCRESLLEHPKGFALGPLETLNRDSRDKPENDTGGVEAPAGALEACPLARVPGGGRGPASAQKRARHTHSPLPAHPDERRDPGPTVRLAPPCSFTPAHAGKPFPDSGIRRNER